MHYNIQVKNYRSSQGIRECSKPIPHSQPEKFLKYKNCKTILNEKVKSLIYVQNNQWNKKYHIYQQTSTTDLQAPDIGRKNTKFVEVKLVCCRETILFTWDSDVKEHHKNKHAVCSIGYQCFYYFFLFIKLFRLINQFNVSVLFIQVWTFFIEIF